VGAERGPWQVALATWNIGVLLSEARLKEVSTDADITDLVTLIPALKEVSTDADIIGVLLSKARLCLSWHSHLHGFSLGGVG
jgi:hypothetical protein